MSARDWLLRAAAVPFVTLAAGPFVIWAALRVRRGWRRARQVIEDTRAFDDAIAVICDPCHGHPGMCRCKSKCTHPLCGAADTGTLYSARDARWLRAIGVSEPISLPAPPDIPGEKPS